MTSTFSEIITWVNELPYWEQAAFDLIIRKENLEDPELDILVDLLLEDKGLKVKTTTRRKLKFSGLKSPASGCSEFNITKLSDLKKY